MINEKDNKYYVFKMETMLESDLENLINAFVLNVKQRRDPIIVNYTVIEDNLLVLKVNRKLNFNEKMLTTDYGTLKRIPSGKIFQHMVIDN
jgi:hypothetical protein